jgi:hypothetical protein
MVKTLIEKLNIPESDLMQMAEKVNEIIDIINAANFCIPKESGEKPPPYFRTPSAGFTPSEQRAFELNYYHQLMAKLASVTPMSSSAPTAQEIVDKAIEIIENYNRSKQAEAKGETREREAEQRGPENNQGEPS